MPRANNNVLAGMRCPACSGLGPFYIVATAFFEVSDEGTLDYRDVEWEDTAVCSCSACHERGTVRSFTVGSSAYRRRYVESRDPIKEAHVRAARAAEKSVSGLPG